MPALQADEVYEALQRGDAGVVELAMLGVVLEEKGVGRQVARLLQLSDGLQIFSDDNSLNLTGSTSVGSYYKVRGLIWF